MSDLQCPATVLIVRHGEATYAVDGVLDVGPSDEGGTLTDNGRGQVRHLVEQLRSRRVAAVYSGRFGPAVKSAALAASALDLVPVVVDALQEVFEGETGQDYPGAEGDQSAFERFAEAIGEIADAHRGESVLVFTNGETMSLAIPRSSLKVGLNPSGQPCLPSCAVAEVEVDADGWRLVSWPGQTLSGS